MRLFQDVDRKRVYFRSLMRFVTGHEEVASRLIEAGAEVDQAANDGRTPLHYACGHGHAEVAVAHEMRLFGGR